MNKGHSKLRLDIDQFKVRSLIDKDTYRVKYIIKTLTVAGSSSKFGIHTELI